MPRDRDPETAFADARRRGEQLQRELAALAGGLLLPAEAAQRAGLTVAELEERTARHELLAVEDRDQGRRWPACVLDDPDVLGPRLRALREVASIESDWMWLAELLQPDPVLGGETPLAALRAGRVDEVVASFAGWGEHRALKDLRSGGRIVSGG